MENIYGFISDTILRYTGLLWAQLLQLLPYWISGVFAGAVLKQFLKGDRLRSVLVKAGRLGIPAGALLGIISPLCLFGALPILAQFSEAGLSIGATWAFLISSPLLNPNLLILTWGGLGWKIALLRIGSSLAIGILGGMVVEALVRRNGKYWESICGNSFLLRYKLSTDSSPASRFSYRKLWIDFVDSLSFTGKYLAGGIAIAAAIEILVPQVWLMKLLGGADKGLAVLIATGLGVPLYMCGGGSIPLIRAFMYTGGLSLGGAMAFMIAGPSTKASNITALVSALGKKGFVLYITINVVSAILLGYLIDIII